MQSFEDEEDPREQKMANGREKGIVKDEEEWTKTPARPRHPGDVSAHLQVGAAVAVTGSSLKLPEMSVGHPLRQRRERRAG